MFRHPGRREGCLLSGSEGRLSLPILREINQTLSVLFAYWLLLHAEWRRVRQNSSFCSCWKERLSLVVKGCSYHCTLTHKVDCITCHNAPTITFPKLRKKERIVDRLALEAKRKTFSLSVICGFSEAPNMYFLVWQQDRVLSWLANWLWHVKLVKCPFKLQVIFSSYWGQAVLWLNMKLIHKYEIPPQKALGNGDQTPGVEKFRHLRGLTALQGMETIPINMIIHNSQKTHGLCKFWKRHFFILQSLTQNKGALFFSQPVWQKQTRWRV